MSYFEELKRRNVIRVAVAYLAATWLLTEIASTVFPLFGVPDWGTRFVVIILALGFVPTLIFSWAYELTPEGLKKEKNVVREESITELTARRLDSITIAVVVLALAVFAADRLWLDSKMAEPSVLIQSTTPAQTGQGDTTLSEYQPNSIAVLPFVNMSADADNEYFSDGISEELLNLLSSLPDLRVTARTSSFSFKHKDITIADIAHELKVAHVLEGSVRKTGNQVRVTVQLIETESETHLWSETYDRTLEDIFAIQDEIAGEVVNSLKETLLGQKSLKENLLGQEAPKTRKTDPEAYVLYLQCRYLSTGTLEELLKAEHYCRQSLEIDPSYAPSWASLATVYTNLAINGYMSFQEGYGKKLEYTRRALELDPNLAYAYGALGWYSMMYERDLPAAAALYRTALKLAPNDARILGGAAVFAETMGDFDRAIELSDRAIAVDPLNYVTYSNVAIVHCWSGQFERANARFEKAIELKPNKGGNPWRAKCYLQQGQPDKALAESESIDLEVRQLWIQSMAYHDLGQHAASDQDLELLIKKYPHEAASFIAENYAWRSEPDLAFEWLNRAMEEKQYMWGSLVFDPAFRSLHEDPRWADLRARDGRSEELIKTIDF